MYFYSERSNLNFITHTSSYRNYLKSCINWVCLWVADRQKHDQPILQSHKDFLSNITILSVEPINEVWKLENWQLCVLF